MLRYVKGLQLKVEAVEAQRKRDLRMAEAQTKKDIKKVERRAKKTSRTRTSSNWNWREDQTTRTARESSHLDFHSEKRKKTEIANQLALNSNA